MKIIVDTNIWISFLIGKKLSAPINMKAKSSIRDVNDLYLLSFAETIQADYILTGDKDLLVLESHQQTRIITYSEFSDL